jgi:hypothetical protein
MVSGINSSNCSHSYFLRKRAYINILSESETQSSICQSEQTSATSVR